MTMASREKKKPLRETAALQYDPERDAAPRVVATGRGLVAEGILERAQASGVPVHIDPELAHTLNLLGVGREIPPELYTVAAQILLFVAHVDEKSNKLPHT